MNEESLFSAACALPPGAERDALLDRECASNPTLRGRLKELLAAHDASSGILDQGGEIERTVIRPADADADADPVGQQVGDIVAGRYKLLEQIGEGGMGAVWVAEQTQPVRRKVALKLIKAGMDSRSVIARFEAERQALALMDHPNIAKVLDAGTTSDGRPYFAMELVKGVPITEFCDTRKLSSRERLELFVPVCQAIQHAHQKGIIHRDIKPSNVLVALHDERPVPKVIDFGVAKAVGQQLTEKTLYTGFGALVGTPAYMAPEQATFNQLDVDTRADVYALGVMLYELLVGSPPFEPERLKKAALDEVLRLVREEEPPRPSVRLSTSQARASIAAVRQSDPDKLTRLVRGELDWIVMKALEKDRNRRYETANGFATDLQRYLAGEPVAAVPPSTAYRLQKFAKRNRVALATTSAFFGLLLVGTIVSVGFALRADHARLVALDAEAREHEQRTEAERERNRAKQAEASAETSAGLARDEARRADDKSREVERSVYVDHMHLAQSAWQNHDVELVREYLNRQRPAPEHADLRGFEWYYWNRLAHRELLTIPQPEGYVSCVTFTPDGRRLASGASDGSATLWDAATGNVVCLLPKHHTPILCIACSFDGTRIACGTEEGAVLVTDLATAQLLHTIPGHASAVRGVAFSPDGQWLVTGGDDQILMLWDSVAGTEQRTFVAHSGRVNSVAFSPDGRSVASGSEDTDVRLWDVATGETKQTLSNPDHAISSVAFSPDGTKLAAATRISIQGRATNANFIHIWDLATGTRHRTIEGQSRQIHGVAFNPNGDRIVSGGGDQTVHFWDFATGASLHEFQGHASSVNGVAFSPDGRRIASAGGNPWGGSENSIKIWDATATPEPVTIESAAYCVAFSPDGKLLAAYDLGASRSSIYDACTGERLRSLQEATGDATGLAFSPDGQRLATGNYSGKIQLWDAATGKLSLTVEEPGCWIRSVTFSPDGTRLAAANVGKSMTVWNAVSGAEMGELTGYPRSTLSAAFSPNHKWLATTHGDGTIWIWDAVTLKKFKTIECHLDTVRSVAFHPDGTQIATASDDHSVKLWSTATWKLQRELKGHREKLMCLSYSPDGSGLASAGWDANILLWNLATGHPVLALPHGLVSSLAFSPDGTRIASAGFDGRVNLWHAPRDLPESERVPGSR
jgi:eukaryotic-like serine/threonine-protein kinase